MTRFTPSEYLETTPHRLALGIEPIDAERGGRIAQPIEVTLDDAPAPGLMRPRIERHGTCLHALRFFVDSDDRLDLQFYQSDKRLPPLRRQVLIPAAAVIDLRLWDRARRFVPRRLRIPILTATAAEGVRYTHRTRRPTLFPGAAYDVGATATGLRGRVLREGQPMRWARVAATVPSNGVVVGRAHGDDRGEFLLMIGANAIQIGDLVDPLSIRVTVFGPATVPVSPASDALTLRCAVGRSSGNGIGSRHARSGISGPSASAELRFNCYK